MSDQNQYIHIEFPSEGPDSFLRNGYVQISALVVEDFHGNEVWIQAKTSKGYVANGFIRVTPKCFAQVAEEYLKKIGRWPKTEGLTP